MKKIIRFSLLLVHSLIILSCSKHEDYVDPYAFTVNQSLELKPNTVALAIMIDPIYSGNPKNYLLSILADGTVDTLKVTDTNGNDVSNLLIPMALENLNADLTLITFARNANIATDAYILNKKTNSFINVSEFGIPEGLEYQSSPVKTFVVNAEDDSYYYVSRTSNFNQRITELKILGSTITGSYITPDSMQIYGFDRDIDGNFWITYVGSNISKNVIVNKNMKKISASQPLPQRAFWLSANQTFNFNYEGNIFNSLYNSTTEIMTFPQRTNNLNFPYKGTYFRAKFSDYMYLFDSRNLIIDNKSNITISTTAFDHDRITAADYSISTKEAYIAVKPNSGTEALYKYSMNSGTVSNSILVADGLYEYYDIEALEDGNFYFSAKRLSDNKIILAKSTAAGVITVLSDNFTGQVGYIEKTIEYTNKY